MASYQYVYHMDGVSKTYPGGKKCFENIRLSFLPGVKIGVVGVNGAGKSTFINVLAGMVMKSGGSAEIWGFDIDKNPRQARASIGIVPQELSIDPFFTPGEIKDFQRAALAFRHAIHAGL